MVNLIRKRFLYILAGISGIILAAAFFNVGLQWLVWIGLVPFLVVLEKEDKFKQLIGESFVFGVVFFGVVLYWLYYVTVAGLVLLVCYLSIYYILFALSTKFLYKSKTIRTYSKIFIIPSLWVIFEYLRGYLFSGFGWASLGYCQYRNLNFIQIASFTGAYGVSFLIVAVNVLIKEFILNIKSILFFNRTYLKKFAYILLTVFILLLSVYIYGDIVLNRKTKGKKITVSVIQGNIPQQQKWEAFYRDLILEKYVRLTEMASFDQPDVIIWPETSVPGYLQEEDLLRQLSDLAKTTESPLLVGAVTMDEKNKKFYNSAALFSKQGVLTKVYDKIHLVPFGEYVPAPYIFSFSKDWVQSFDFSSGTAYTLFSVKGAKFGVLICFEDVFPNLVRNFVNQGADFMVNITNDAWFMQSVEPYQHLQASVFRAIENRINIARAANTGISCFVDPQGHIAERISFNDKDIFIEGFATQTIVINNKKSFYSKFGDVFVLLTSIALVFSVLIDFLKK